MNRNAKDIHKAVAQLLSGIDKSADEGNCTTPATTGQHAADLTSKVKSDVQGTSVDAAKPASNDPPEGAGKNTDLFDIGVKATPTGEDGPTVKTTQEDPGTSHQAKVASVNFTSKSARDLASAAQTILSNFAKVASSAKPVEVAAQTAKQVASTAGSANSIEKQAADQWKQLMGYLSGTAAAQQVKTASDKSAKDEDEAFMKFAYEQASQVEDYARTLAAESVDFLRGYATTLVKQAQDGGEIDPMILEELLAAESGGEMPMGGGGEMPMGGGDEMPMGGDLGGDMGGDMGGEMGGDPSEEELDMMLQALEAEGVSPEEIIAGLEAIQAEQGGGGGEVMPAGELMEPEAAPAPEGEDPVEDARALAMSDSGNAAADEGVDKQAAARVEVAKAFAAFCKKAAEIKDKK